MEMEVDGLVEDDSRKVMDPKNGTQLETRNVMVGERKKLVTKRRNQIQQSVTGGSN